MPPRSTKARPRPWPRVLAGLMPRGRRAAVGAPGNGNGAGALVGTAAPGPVLGAPLDLGAASVPATAVSSAWATSLASSTW